MSEIIKRHSAYLNEQEHERALAELKRRNEGAVHSVYMMGLLREFIVAGMDSLKLPFPKTKRGKS